jgi:imidazolonepropionase-like amidohydrolase
VFDGEKKIESTNVLVVDGKISAVGPKVKAAEGSKAIEGTGRTLMPGMIDSHTHVWSATDLQRAATFGVTTELDMMGSAFAGAMFRKHQSEGKANDRADYFSAGAAVTVKDGHGTQFGLPVPTLDRAEDADQFVNDRVREGSDYIKLIHEDGSPYGRTMPTLSEEMFAGAVKAAHRNEKIAVAHISTQAGAKMAFENDIDGLVHLFADKPIDAVVIELAKSKGVFVAPTASVISNTLGQSPLSELLTDKNLLPMLDNATMASLARTYPEKFASKERWKNFKNNIKALHEAGVPILAGTDSPNPGTYHGVSMHMEIRLLVSTGLSPTESLTAATSAPAKHFGLKDRGRIAPGLRADMILVEGDPTVDITAVSNIVGVWKAGFSIDRQSQLDAVAAEAKAAEAEPVK